MRRHLLGALSAAAAAAVLAAPPEERRAPQYSSAKVFNLGSGLPALAPNTLAVIFGENLSRGVASRADISTSPAVLPTSLPGTGVTVKVNGLLAAIEYASPDAVVFIVPPELLPGTATVVVTTNSVNGPAVRVTLKQAAPALLPFESSWALARDAESLEWSLPQRPLHPGATAVLYGTGWGPTQRPSINLQTTSRPTELRARSAVTVYLDGMAVPPDHVIYAGLTVGAAAVYELRFRLPAWTPPDPEIRIAIGEELTQPGLRLPVSPAVVQPGDQRMRSYQ